MPRLLRWTRTLRRVAWRGGVLRDGTRAARRHVAAYLDDEGRRLQEASGVPGLSVLVRFAQGGEVERHFGHARPGVPMGPRTLVQVLSLTKSVTAMVALALVEDGLLALDEPIWRRLRSWRLPAHRTGGFDPDGVTLRRVLSHHAGLSVRGFGWATTPAPEPARRLLEQERDEATTLRLVAAPGRGLRYSGGGFALVELLVEDVTGRPWPQVVRERVLAPLGLPSAGFEPSLLHAPDLAARHDGENRPLPAAHLASVAGSGCFATAREVATLFALPSPGPGRSPPGGGVLSPASCDAMLTPHGGDARAGIPGLGVFLRARRADLKYMHAGFDHGAGWTCRAEGLRRRQVVVVLLSNGDRGQACVPAMAHAIRHLLYDVAI